MIPTLAVFPAHSLLRVTVTGDYTRAGAHGTIDPTLEALIHHSLTKVLVDFRQVSGHPSLMERYAFGTALAQKFSIAAVTCLDLHTRFGFLGQEPMLEKCRFVETVSLNRGLKLKVTESMGEALVWLDIDPAFDEASP